MDCVLISGDSGGFIEAHFARELHRQGLFARIANIKFDRYVKANFCSRNLAITLCNLENCHNATKQ